MYILPHHLFSPATLDRDKISPACLQQPDEGVFGLLTVVQGMGDITDSQVDPETLMEISDYRVIVKKM